MQPNQQEKVYAKMLKAGGKNYFFDIKKASNGSNYLTVAESYKKQTGESVTNRSWCLGIILHRLLQNWPTLENFCNNF